MFYIFSAALPVLVLAAVLIHQEDLVVQDLEVLPEGKYVFICI